MSQSTAMVMSGHVQDLKYFLKYDFRSSTEQVACAGIFRKQLKCRSIDDKFTIPYF